METNKDSLDEQRLITASELGVLIGRSTKSINVDVRRRPETLPPRFTIPGTRKNLWRVKDVRDWMDALAEIMAQKRVKERAFAKQQGITENLVSRPFHLGRRHESAAANELLKGKQS